MSTSSVLIYRDQLLPGSETFIPAQAEALPTYDAYYAGMKRVREGLDLPEDRVAVVNESANALGRLKEAAAQFLWFPRRYMEKIEAWNPSLIHAHFGPDALNALRLADHLSIPLAVTYHGYDVTTHDVYARQSFYRHRVYLRNRERVKKEVDCFIAVSGFIRQELIDKGFPEDRIVQHYIGIDVDAFTADASVEREEVILFVGRLVEKKGGEYLIRAGARVQETHPAVKVVIVGDGPLREELELLANDVGCNARFLGHQPPHVVRHWLNRARVFCVPSLVAESGDAEAFGMVFAEAQAMGVPVASFESGGIPEVVKHDETGLLAPEHDWMQLADNIGRLLQDLGEWQRFSEAGITHVRSNFDVAEQSSRLESIYEKIKA